MFSLELEDEEESHFYLILKAGSFHLMLDMHLCNVQSCKRSYASQPLRYAKNYIFGNKQTDPNMCYMSSNKVNFAFQMTQEYLMILLSMNDVNSIIGTVKSLLVAALKQQPPLNSSRNKMQFSFSKFWAKNSSILIVAAATNKDFTVVNPLIITIFYHDKVLPR